MWIMASEEYCVVLYGQIYYVCRRVPGGKLACLYQCFSYQEAEVIYRQFLRNN